MWKKPWGYKEGFICGAGLLVTGLLLQSITGGIRWELFAWSINIIVLALYLFLLTAMHLLRKRVYAFEWLSHYTSAVSSLIYVAAITVLMGCIRQVPSTQSPVDLLGLSKMLSFWPFVLLYSWLASALGLTILRTSFPLKVRKIPFLLNHMGLFIVLLTTTFGSADLQRLRMITQIGKTEWRATDENGKLVELPLAIELKDFTIYEYPPKLMLIDNRTGQPLPANAPEHLLLEDGITSGKLLDWEVTILQSIPMAASVATEDTLKYTEFHSMGATYAIYLTATNTNTGQTKRGWVSNGSFAFPYKALHLNGENSLVMPEREPQRFVSDVTVYTQEGSILQDTIEVNHPLKVAGWNIYQLSYDETKGRWSNISIFELVRDPWLPFVYTGIIMMVLGAICLFINAPKEKEVSSDEKQTEYKEEEKYMSWDYFGVFAIAALHFWGFGAFAAWHGKRPTAVYVLTLTGLAIFFSFIIAMWISLERPPMRTMGETRLWYSFFLPLAGLITYSRWKYKWILSFSFILSLVFICINLFKPEIHNKTLMPALQSPWFTPHVIVYMFAYALLGAAAVMAVHLLWFKKKEIERREMDLCDNLTYVGLAFMTLGMLSGAVWAKAAWGHYWAWDPKETWAAATWFSYLGYIHFRLGRPSAHRKALIGLLVSFLLLQMCWYGINYLPSAQGISIHTYNVE